MENCILSHMYKLQNSLKYVVQTGRELNAIFKLNEKQQEALGNYTSAEEYSREAIQRQNTSLFSPLPDRQPKAQSIGPSLHDSENPMLDDGLDNFIDRMCPPIISSNITRLKLRCFEYYKRLNFLFEAV